jgi:membrane fusion protein, multidrug efflux system
MEIFRQRFTSAIAVLLASIFLAACGKKPADQQGRSAMPPVPVQTGFASRKDVPVDLTAIGNVESIATIAVKAQVTGELIDVSFTEGQDVKKGDLLFTIQPRLYATQLAQAEANLARDRAQAANAKRELARQEELARKNVASKEELDRSRAQADALEATVRADEALVLIAQTQLGYTTIETPIDGRTGSIRVRPGNLIRNTSDEPLTTVVQLAPIYVTFSVPEQYLDDVRKGMAERKMSVAARSAHGEKDLGEGVLTFVDNSVNAATGTVLLKATFPNTDRTLWPGAFVDVVLRLDTERGVTVVPAPAVSIGQRGSQVYVVKADGTAELRPVKTGRSVNQEIVILEGVAEGEKVVVNGQSRLIPGAKVLEKSATPAPNSGSSERPAVAPATGTPKQAGASRAPRDVSGHA